MALDAQAVGAMMKSEVSYNSGDVSLASFGDSATDLTYRPSTTKIDWGWYQNYWNPTIIREYYPSYVTQVVTEEDKFKKAFKVAKLLLKQRLLNSRKLPEFIKLIELIAGEI